MKVGDKVRFKSEVTVDDLLDIGIAHKTEEVLAGEHVISDRDVGDKYAALAIGYIVNHEMLEVIPHE